MADMKSEATSQKRILLQALAVTTMAMLSIGFVVIPAAAVKQVSTDYSMPVHASMVASASGCENSPGPVVTLEGALALGGLGAELVFKNNVKGTHTHVEQSTAEVVVIPEGESIQIPKQPVNGGVGGNPFIWLQFVDSNGNALTPEFFLGRCVQGPMDISADFFIPSTATAVVASDSCSNTGSTIKLDGELALTGINAKLIFRNNDNPVGGPHEHDEPTTVDIVIIPAGQSIEFAKQPPLGGVGGNPLISIRFLDGNGQPIGDEFDLGRCNKL